MNRMTNRKRFLSVLMLAVLAIPFTSHAQDETKNKRQRPPRQNQNLSPEEQRALIEKQIVETIESYETEMGNNAPREDQLAAFTKIIGQSHLDQLKLNGEMRKNREGKKGRPSQEEMMAMQQKRQKIDSQLLKSMKELLDKKQFKAFKKAKEKLQPQRSGPPGGGRGAGGGGGGGRGAGGAGGGGGF